MSLAGRKVLLGVTGGIAAYKSADLVRRIREQGAEVRVVMTDGAQAFVTPLTFQAVSGNDVRTDLFDRGAEAAMGHIELARWADVICVAPASADFIARLRAGMANDLLTTLCLATDAKLVIAPAMNRLMWSNPATQENCVTLEQRGVVMLGPASGSQACGETGEGRMLQPLEIVDDLSRLLGEGPLAGKQVLITAGPTLEPIDPVRYISNNSSGKMGYAVAAAAARLGAVVTLVSGPVTLDSPPHVQRVWANSAEEMLNAVMPRAAEADIFIATAAVADYRPAQQANNKIKKQNESLNIALERTEDILATVSATYENVFTVGFAAETDKLLEYARGKLERKQLDMVAANWVNQPGTGFDADQNALTVVTDAGEEELPVMSKAELATELMNRVLGAYQRSAKNV